jgi:hypothetical protein
MPSPPVSFFISAALASRPMLMASVTPLRTRLSRNSTSSGSTTLGSILIDTTSPPPVATTVSLPPPTLASKVCAASFVCMDAAFACISCACFMSFAMFIL